MTTELDALSRTLEQRAASVHLRGASFEDVRGRARRIRRRRQALAGAGVAAALVVAVPLGLGLGSPTALEQAPPAASVTASPVVPTPEPSVAPTNALSSAGVTRGADPAVPYVVGREVRVPGGATVTLPEGTYQSVTRVGDDYWAVRLDLVGGGPRTLVRVSADGRVLDTSPLDDGPVTSADGTVLGWTVDDKAIVAWAGGDRPLQVDSRGTGRLVSVLGSAPCQGDTTCTVVRSEQPGLAPGVERVLAVSQTAFKAFVGPHAGQETCGGMIFEEGTTNTVLWRSCEVYPISFSPDGSRLLVTTPDTDGLGYSTLAVLDTKTGDELARWVRRGADDAVAPSVVWEDDTHVLALTYQGGSWTVLRLGVDGSTQTATDPVQGADDVAPIGLPVR